MSGVSVDELIKLVQIGPDWCSSVQGSKPFGEVRSIRIRKSNRRRDVIQVFTAYKNTAFACFHKRLRQFLQKFNLRGTVCITNPAGWPISGCLFDI